MLETSRILNFPEEIIKKLEYRGLEYSELIYKIVDLENQRKQNQSDYDSLNGEYKKLSNEIYDLSRNVSEKNDELIFDLKKKSKSCKNSIDEKKKKLQSLSQEIKDILYKLPNIPHFSVPKGKSVEDNVVIHEKKFSNSLFQRKLPHWELIKNYKIIDFETGVKISGAGYPVYFGQGAKLQRALINFLLEEASKEGYLEVQVPLVVNEDSAYGTGQLPDMEGQMYEILNEKKYLISTSEIPLTNIYKEEFIEKKNCPIKMCSYTPCFRREAGSWGADVKGLNRLHQFDKVELVHITTQEKSYEEMENISNFLKKTLEKLKITYRVLNLCTYDMGSKAALQYDFEVWSEGQKKWLEVSSLSNFETYQSNRLNIKYKDEKKNKFLAHTLNASCFGIPRLMIAILENFQEDKEIKIPEVLSDYTKFDKITF